MQPDLKTRCYCQTPKPFRQCCEPLLLGLMKATTPEQLMRSRYSAFCLKDMDYILQTMDPSTRSSFDLENNKEWANSVTFTDLEVLQTPAPLGNKGFVEFKATYTMEDETFTHHERSTFRKVNGEWYFSEGEVVDSDESDDGNEY